MTVGEFIKSYARQNGTSAAKIERDLGFSNGYIGSVNDSSFPHERLVAIAEYLDVSPDFLWNLGESISNSFSGPSLSDMESFLLLQFRKLDPTDCGRVVGFIEGLLANDKYKKASPSAGVDESA